MEIGYKEAGRFLQEHDNYYVLAHRSPDGDTIGSTFALVNVLRAMGKHANARCSDEFPARYEFMYGDYADEDFQAETIVAVDVADTLLLGKGLAEYADKIDLCIDHHISNIFYATATLLNAKASATCEVLAKLFFEMGMPMDDHVATCLYTGIATDTGCFKYQNTTQEAHRITAELMDYKVDYAGINRRLFDIKSKARLLVEQLLSARMEFFLDDKCAMITITKELIGASGMDESDFEGLASLTLQVDGIEVGVTLKERDNGGYKVSMRSSNKVNVSEICQGFGGGGHIKAAGCILDGELPEVKVMIIAAVAKGIEQDG